MSKTTSDACVSWIEGRVPDTEEACIVHALITERGVRTRHALAHPLAQELFERDRRRVGYLAGIGIFLVHARRCGAARVLLAQPPAPPPASPPPPSSLLAPV